MTPSQPPVVADPTAYGQLTDAEQVEALRPVAVGAAEAFGLTVHRLEVHRHAYNTTFAVHTTDGQQWALRVNTNSASQAAEIATQQAWQLALAHQTPVLVPTPRRTVEGDWCARIPSEPLGREVLVTCANWLAGDDVGEAPTPEVARELGSAMAHLHRQAASWSLPTGGAMPTFADPLFGDTDHLATLELERSDRAVIDAAMSQARASFDRAYAGVPVIALHADLHGGNLKWHGGRLAVFDFDDCGLGIPALDLAISTFYLRGGDPAAETALRAGYAAIAPLPEVDPGDFEALVAGRQLLLANDLVTNTTAQLRELARSYLPMTVERLRHWQRTGRFTRVLPGP